MSENRKSSAVVTDDESLASTAKSPEIPKQKSRKLAIAVALSALILILAVIAAGFYYYQENQRVGDQLQRNITQLNKQVSLLQKDLHKTSQSSLSSQGNLQTQVEQVNRQLQQLKNANKLYKTDVQALQRALAETKVRHPNDWILSEVEYLVKLAGRKIWLENDISSAIALLEAADQRVVELSDASLNALRAALLEDIGTLEALPKSDPDGVVLLLSALERRVDKLDISGLSLADELIKNEQTLTADINDWKQNLAKTWSNFIDSFIVINKRETQLQALLSPDQGWYLQENLRHDLAKAEFAVYREQQDIYDLALHSAADRIKNYYDLKDNATANFYQSVLSLSERKISIDYPDQLKSAPLLERIIEQRVKKSLASFRLKQE